MRLYTRRPNTPQRIGCEFAGKIDISSSKELQQVKLTALTGPDITEGVMSYRSSLPVVLMSMAGLVAVGFLATCGANKAAADPSGDRLGCGTFCQTAGGYGGAGPAPSQYAVTVMSNGTVTADADGYVPVTLTCHLSTQCAGVVILSGPTFSGRSDLIVDAGATRTIGVPLPSSAIAYLRSNGPTNLNVTADARQSAGLNEQAGGPAAINIHSQLTVAAQG
jgi:hypothetical protein